MEDKQQNQEIIERDASFEPEVVERDASFEQEMDMTEDELQDTLLEDSGMNAFQKFIARMDDKKWTLTQHILGVVLALATCIALFWPGNAETESAFSYSLIFAFVFALIVPNIIERQGLRKINIARKTMAIALAVGVVVFFLYTGFTQGFRFFAK